MEKFAVFAEIIVESGQPIRMWAVPLSEREIEIRRTEIPGSKSCWIADFEAPDRNAAVKMAQDQENERLDDDRS